MTPQESVAAYEAWCAANKSFQLVWKESGANKTFKAHYFQTIVDKMIEVEPLTEINLMNPFFTVTRPEMSPTFEGYKEWLQYQ